MSFLSSIGKMPVIDDSNFQSFLSAPPGQSFGMLPRDYVDVPYGCMPFAPAADMDEIHRSDWAAIIEERERLKNRIPDLCDAVGSKVKNQKSTNYCFPAGTCIRMADGTHKPIEQLRVLDKVLTAEGNVRPVIKTVVHEINEPIYRLKVWGHNHLMATSEHPILTKRGYVSISELKIGDFVAFPRFSPKTVTLIQTGDYLYELNTVPQSKRKYRTYNYAPYQGSSHVVGIPGKSYVKITRHPVPDVIQLTPEFGRLCGLYLAEGHTSPWAVYFSFNATEKDTLASECALLIKTCLGCEAHIRVRKTVCQVSIYGANWSKLFDALFSRGSDSKRLCPDLASGPINFLEQVLHGWVEGDRKQNNSAVTVSKTLALNMFDIANALGLRPIMTTHQYSKTGSDGISRKHSWMIDWREKINHGTEQDETHLWRTVRGLEQEEFQGFVFNIEVAGDNSYVAEGIGVHNCWINCVVRAMEIVRVVQNQSNVPLSSASIGCKIKNFQNRGGWNIEGVEYAVRYGAIPESLWPNAAIDRQYDTVETNLVRERYRIIEWEDLPNTFSAVMSRVLRNIPCPVGYNWWGHAVCAVDGRVLGPNEFGLVIDNSWSTDWGDNGRGILNESKGRPDDAQAPRTGTPA